MLVCSYAEKKRKTFLWTLFVQYCILFATCLMFQIWWYFSLPHWVHLYLLWMIKIKLNLWVYLFWEINCLRLCATWLVKIELSLKISDLVTDGTLVTVHVGHTAWQVFLWFLQLAYTLKFDFPIASIKVIQSMASWQLGQLTANFSKF